MEKVVLERKYNMSTAELYAFTYKLVPILRRDLIPLAAYGVTELKIVALETLNGEMINLPQDDILRSDVSNAVLERTEIRHTIINTMRSIGIRAKAVYKKNPARERVLDIPATSSMTEIELIHAAESQHTNAVMFLNDLKSEGITAEYLTAFMANITLFKNAQENIDALITLRAEGTQNRTEIGNQVYDMIAKYCDYGKAIYKNVNPARYNEYVIYTPSAGSLKAPTGLRFIFAGSTFAWNIEKKATSYQLEYSEDGITFTEVYVGMAEYCNYTPANEGWSYYRVRARNSNGYGPYSLVLKQGYYANLPAPTNLKAQLVSGTTDEISFTWDEVPSSTYYSVYSSVVAIGAAAGEFAYKGNVTTNAYLSEVITGKRYYFRLTAGNTVQWSGTSVNCFIDVE